MINPPDRRYPGPGRPPTVTDQARYMRSVDALQQGNPSDGGTIGVGVDESGTQIRDWGTRSILARITSHGTGNAYGWEEVFLDDTGTADTVSGGLSGDDTDNPAYEVNDSATVAVNTIVELWPNYSPEPYWTFVEPASGGSGTVGVAVDIVHVTAQTANLGSHLQFTVKSVVRNAGTGTWEEGGLGLTYTGVFEFQDRLAVISPTSTPVQGAVHPLYVDDNGKYSFSIDQNVGYGSTTTVPVLQSQTWVSTYQAIYFTDAAASTPVGSIGGSDIDNNPLDPPGTVQGGFAGSCPGGDGSGPSFSLYRYAGGDQIFYLNYLSAADTLYVRYGIRDAGGVERPGIYYDYLTVANPDGGFYQITVYGGLWYRIDLVVPGFAAGAPGGFTPLGGEAGPPYVGGGPKIGGGPQEQFESGTGPEE